ncbi:MAG: hypothetical protein U1E53_18535 [Dongiaceae bacterium]
MMRPDRRPARRHGGGERLFLLWPGLDLWASGLFHRDGGDFWLRWSAAAAIHDAVPLPMGLVILAVLGCSPGTSGAACRAAGRWPAPASSRSAS